MTNFDSQRKQSASKSDTKRPFFEHKTQPKPGAPKPGTKSSFFSPPAASSLSTKKVSQPPPSQMDVFAPGSSDQLQEYMRGLIGQAVDKVEKGEKLPASHQTKIQRLMVAEGWIQRADETFDYREVLRSLVAHVPSKSALHRGLKNATVKRTQQSIAGSYQGASTTTNELPIFSVEPGRSIQDYFDDQITKGWLTHRVSHSVKKASEGLQSPSGNKYKKWEQHQSLRLPESMIFTLNHSAGDHQSKATGKRTSSQAANEGQASSVPNQLSFSDAGANPVTYQLEKVHYWQGDHYMSFQKVGKAWKHTDDLGTQSGNGVTAVGQPIQDAIAGKGITSASYIRTDINVQPTWAKQPQRAEQTPGQIEHINNSCYLADLIYLIAGDPTLSPLFKSAIDVAPSNKQIAQAIQKANKKQDSSDIEALEDDASKSESSRSDTGSTLSDTGSTLLDKPPVPIDKLLLFDNLKQDIEAMDSPSPKPKKPQKKGASSSPKKANLHRKKKGSSKKRVVKSRSVSRLRLLYQDCDKLINRIEREATHEKFHRMFYELTDYYLEIVGSRLRNNKKILLANKQILLKKKRRKADFANGFANIQSNIQSVYKDLQELSVWLLSPIQKNHIIDSGVGKDAEDDQAMEVLSGDVDYRVMRLVALLRKRKRSTGQGQFKAVIKFLGGNGNQRKKLSRRYLIVRGQSLDADLQLTFGKATSLRYLYVKQILDNGKPSVEAQLALKLGLLYVSWFPTPTKSGDIGSALGRLLLGSMEDKLRIVDLVAEHPEKFSGLLDNNMGPQTLFIQKIRKHLEGRGVLGEIKALVKLSQPKNVKGQSKTKKEISQDHSHYLMSLISNESRNEYRVSVGHAHLYIQQLKDRLIAWALKAPVDEQKAFVAAGEFIYDGKILSNATKKKVRGYIKFWSRVKGRTLMVAAKAHYVLKIVSGKYEQKSQDKASKLNELEAILELHATDKWWIKKRLGRTSIKHLVMQYLSVPEDGNFDPQLALIEKYHPNGKAKLSKAISASNSNTPGNRTQLKKLVDESFTKFRPHLVAAQLNDSQIQQVYQFILLRGAEGEGGAAYNKVSTYQKLKKMAANRTYKPKTILELVQQLEPNTLEMQLVRNDIRLVKYIKAFVNIYSSKHKKWNAIRTILTYGSSDESDSPMGVPKIFTNQDIAYFKQFNLDQQNPEFWAGKLSAEYRLTKDGNRALEIAYQASQNNVNGKDVGKALHSLNYAAYKLMAFRKRKWADQRGERSAFKALSAYLIRDHKVDLASVVHSARAVTKFGADSDGVDFAIDSITEENVFELIDRERYNQLQSIADKRFYARLDLHEAEQNNDKKKAVQAQKTIRRLTKEINNFGLLIDKSLMHKFSKVVRRGQYAAIKRQVYIVLGDAMQKGQRGALKISPEEAQFKGSQTKGKADVLNQKYLETGIAWDHRSTVGTETAEAMGGYLGTLWTHQSPLERISNKRTPDKQEQADRQSWLKELEQAESNLTQYQSLFKQAQDKFNEQTKRIVTTLVTLLITIAGLSVGVGASLGVIQLIWTIGTSLLESAISQLLEYGLSRDGDYSKAEATKETTVKLISDVIGFALVSELTLAVDLMGMGLHTGSHAQKLFGRPALGVLKGQINSMVGDLPESVVNQFFKKHPVSELNKDIYQALNAKLKALPTEVIVSFLQGLTVEGVRMGNVAITKALGIEGAQWSSPGSAVANQYDDSANAETAEKQFMGFSDGGWNFNDMGQFVGGPKRVLGADASALNFIAGQSSEYEGSQVPSYILNATKTALYEELVGDKLKSSVENATTTVIDSAVGLQDANASIATPESVSANDASRNMKRNHKALEIVIGYLRHIGLTITDTNKPREVRQQIRAQVKDKQHADRVIKLFRDYYKHTVSALKPPKKT